MDHPHDAPNGESSSDDEWDALEPYVLEDPDLLTHFHYAKVGQITVRFTHMEVLLKILAAHLLGDVRAGQIATASLSVRQLQELVVALGREKWGDSAPEFVKLTNVNGTVNDARIERNKVIHGTWLVVGDGEARSHTRTSIKLKGKGTKRSLHIEHGPFELEELEDVFTSVDEAVESLLAFLVWVFPNFSEETSDR